LTLLSTLLICAQGTVNDDDLSFPHPDLDMFHRQASVILCL